MITIIQNILIVLLGSYMTIDNQGLTILNNWAVNVALVSGLIMGNLPEAMVIGGTFQLMSLGVVGAGGASVPDYGVATLVGVYLSARTGAGISGAVAVGLPVGLLTIQLDVLIKLSNNFIAHKMQSYAHEKQFSKMRAINWVSVGLFALKNFIPMIIIVTVGPAAISEILKVIPKWFTNGLSIAGSMLPVVGIGMLMHYMPTKKYVWVVMIGFVLSAYLKVPVLGVAIIGLAVALYIYQQLTSKGKPAQTATANGADTQADDEGDDYDE